MNILQKVNLYKMHADEYELLKTLPGSVDLYLSSYDVLGMSVDDMMKEFVKVYGDYHISNRDFICIAKSLGYEHKQICVEGTRFYTLVKE